MYDVITSQTPSPPLSSKFLGLIAPGVRGGLAKVLHLTREEGGLQGSHEHENEKFLLNENSTFCHLVSQRGDLRLTNFVFVFSHNLRVNFNQMHIITNPDLINLTMLTLASSAIPLSPPSSCKLFKCKLDTTAHGPSTALDLVKFLIELDSTTCRGVNSLQLVEGLIYYQR